MKRYKLILFVFLAVLLVCSCKKDYEAPGTLKDFAWSMGQEPGEQWARNVGEVFTFRDASQGALSRVWIIEEGNYFLDEGFNPDNDSLPLFINTEKGLRSNDHTVHVLLNNPGINKIKLRCTFDEKITWYGNYDTVEAVQQGSEWIVDYTFEVDVYEPIQPALSIVKDGIEILYLRPGAEILPEEEWDTLTIEGGSQIQFIDKTTIGRPSGRTWYIEGQSNPYFDSVANVSFYSMGVFHAGFVSKRQYPLPVANTSTIVPLHIKVVKSTKPFEFLSAERDNDKIMLQVSGEVVDFSGENSNFQVHVKNGSYDQVVDVASAYVDPENRIQIILELSELFYDNDTIAVSYTGSSITSIDERTLNTFSDQPIPIVIHYENSVVDADIFGFELETAGRGGAEGWWTQGDPSNFDRTMYANAAQGDYVHWCHTDDYTSAPIFRIHGPNGTYGLPLTEGPYIVSIMIKHITGDLNKMYVASGEWSVKEIFEWDASNTNDWQRINKQITFTGDAVNKVILGVETDYFPGGELHNEFYLDDLKYIPLSARPE